MQQWPGKVLLFGEYTVLLGGEALAVPLSTVGGHWVERGGVPDARLVAWHQWLCDQESREALPWAIRLDAFGDFIARGGCFESSIPGGCGLGSSGALVAGLAATWSAGCPEDADTLRRGLAQLESYFHGNSSGLDPLVSFLKEAILIDSQGRAQRAGPGRLPVGLFLLDSGVSRNTAPLVQQFQEDLQRPDFVQTLQEAVLPQVRSAIAALLAGDDVRFAGDFARISALQYQWLRAMIPDSLAMAWTGGDYHLKLCGAGGGGFFLGYAPGGSPAQLEVHAKERGWALQFIS